MRPIAAIGILSLACMAARIGAALAAWMRVKDRRLPGASENVRGVMTSTRR